MKRSLAAVPLILLLAACGGGGDGDDAEPTTTEASADTTTATGADAEAYVDAFVTKAESRPDAALDPTELECAATGVVDILGVDAFVAADLTPEDIATRAEGDSLADDLEVTDEQATRMAGVMFECVDFGAYFVEQFSASPDAPNIPEDKLRCIGNGLEEDPGFRDLAAQSFLDPTVKVEPDETALAGIFDDCGVTVSELSG